MASSAVRAIIGAFGTVEPFCLAPGSGVEEANEVALPLTPSAFGRSTSKLEAISDSCLLRSSSRVRILMLACGAATKALSCWRSATAEELDVGIRACFGITVTIANTATLATAVIQPQR